jgi:ABC-type multidrug transport system fused ATPase/permease subunit
MGYREPVNCTRPRRVKGIVRRALTFLLPHRWWIGAILLLALATTAVNSFVPLIMKYVVDALERRSGRTVAWGVGGFVLVALLREATGALSNWLTWRTRLRIHFSLTEATVSALHGLPVGLYNLGYHRMLADRLVEGLAAVNEGISVVRSESLERRFGVSYRALGGDILLRLGRWDEAEALVDTLENNGYIRFLGDTSVRSRAESRWSVDPHVP